MIIKCSEDSLAGGQILPEISRSRQAPYSPPPYPTNGQGKSQPSLGTAISQGHLPLQLYNPAHLFGDHFIHLRDYFIQPSCYLVNTTPSGIPPVSFPGPAGTPPGKGGGWGSHHLPGHCRAMECDDGGKGARMGWEHRDNIHPEFGYL